MTTNTSQPYAKLPLRIPVNRAVLDSHHHVLRAVTSIPAERQRVFQAIVLPEYMEAWLNIPGASLGCARITSSQNSFSICCSGAQGGRFSISCLYRLCKRNRVLFDWKHETEGSLSLSSVSIRLLGDFERTTLELVHVGLHQRILPWHRDLWEASLAHLCRLF